QTPKYREENRSCQIFRIQALIRVEGPQAGQPQWLGGPEYSRPRALQAPKALPLHRKSLDRKHLRRIANRKADAFPPVPQGPPAPHLRRPAAAPGPPRDGARESVWHPWPCVSRSRAFVDSQSRTALRKRRARPAPKPALQIA